MIGRTARAVALGVMLVAAGATASHAAGTLIGPRVGFSVAPDQFVFGGQLHTGELAPHLTFDPALELGFGDNETLVAINLDLHYHFQIRGSDWTPYLGLGASVNFESFDHPAPAEDASQTNVGGNFVLGAAAPASTGGRFFAEMKLGLGDAPSLKMLAGWNFALSKK